MGWMIILRTLSEKAECAHDQDHDFTQGENLAISRMVVQVPLVNVLAKQGA